MFSKAKNISWLLKLGFKNSVESAELQMMIPVYYNMFIVMGNDYHYTL